jgi:hypothetical protein
LTAEKNFADPADGTFHLYQIIVKRFLKGFEMEEEEGLKVLIRRRREKNEIYFKKSEKF